MNSINRNMNKAASRGLCFALLCALLPFLLPPGKANDLEKVMNKALSEGKKQLLKKTGSSAQTQLPTSNQTNPAQAQPAAANSSATASPAAPAASSQSQGASAGTPAAATGAPAATPGASAAAHGSDTKSALVEKLKHRAQVEAEKNLKKYGNRLLKQGGQQLNNVVK